MKKPGSAPRVLVDDAHLARYIGNSVLVYQRDRALMAPISTRNADDDRAGRHAVRRPLAGRAVVGRRRRGPRVSALETTTGGSCGSGATAPRFRCQSPPKRYAAPSLSPRAAIASRSKSRRRTFDIWTIDVERQRLSKLTSDGASRYPMWTPDGTNVGVVQRRENTLYLTAPGEGQRAELVRAKLPNLDRIVVAQHAHADLHAGKPGDGAPISGRSISRRRPHVVRADGRPRVRRPGVVGWPMARVFLGRDRGIRAVTPAARAQRAAVPDFDDQRARAGRAREAVWARDGRELFYRHGSQMMSVRVPADEQRPPASLRAVRGRLLCNRRTGHRQLRRLVRRAISDAEGRRGTNAAPQRRPGRGPADSRAAPPVGQRPGGSSRSSSSKKFVTKTTVSCAASSAVCGPATTTRAPSGWRSNFLVGPAVA